MCRGVRACDQMSQYSTELSTAPSTPAGALGDADALLALMAAGEGESTWSAGQALLQGSPMLSPSGRWVPGHVMVFFSSPHQVALCMAAPGMQQPLEFLCAALCTCRSGLE